MNKTSTNIAKGIAILLVFVHHLFYSIETFQGYWINFAPLSMEQTLWFASFSKICVAIFVFLSAYGVMKQTMLRHISDAKAIGDYTIHRLVRVLMNFGFVYVLSILVFYPLSNQLEVYRFDVVSRPYFILIDALGLASVMGTPTFNATWWYMSYALLLIFMLPVLIKLLEKVGAIVILPLTFLLILYLKVDTQTAFGSYLLTAVFGLVAAKSNLFEKISEATKSKLRLSILKDILIIVLIIYLATLRQRFSFVWIIEAFLSTLFALISHTLLSHIPVLKKGLAFLGKHSMNMFLTHTFIYSYYFKPFTYSFHYSILILLVLVVVTLMISIVIETIKKSLGFDKLIDKMTLAFQTHLKN